MPKMNVNGVNLHYEIQGKGPSLILISGFTCDSNFWSLVLPQLKKYFQVITFDNRGVGQSDCPDIPYSIEMMAEDTFRLAERLDLKKPHVLGHSMGGAIAQVLAYQHRDFFNRFAICNSLIKLSPVTAQCLIFQQHLQEGGSSRQLLCEGMLPWVYSSDFLKNSSNGRRVIEAHLKNPRPQTLTGYKRQLEALINFDSSGWLQHIEAPILVLNGMEDLLCPHDSERLAQGIVGSKFINFPRAGHAPMIEEPEEFCNFITLFFKIEDQLEQFNRLA